MEKSIWDLGFGIADFNYDLDLILIQPVRNLPSEIRNSLTPVLQDRKPQRFPAILHFSGGPTYENQVGRATVPADIGRHGGRPYYNRKDRAKRYHKSSIVNLQFRFIRIRLSFP